MGADADGFEVSASTYGKEATALRAAVTRFETGTRFARAARVAGPIALAGLVIIPIPGVHLATIPLLITALVFGIRRFRQTSEVSSLVGPCPGHGESTDFPPPASFPTTVRCPTCAEFVKLEA